MPLPGVGSPRGFGELKAEKEEAMFSPVATEPNKDFSEFVSAVEQSILNGGNPVSREKVNVSHDEESYDAVMLAGEGKNIYVQVVMPTGNENKNLHTYLPGAVENAVVKFMEKPQYQRMAYFYDNGGVSKKSLTKAVGTCDVEVIDGGARAKVEFFDFKKASEEDRLSVERVEEIVGDNQVDFYVERTDSLIKMLTNGQATLVSVGFGTRKHGVVQDDYELSHFTFIPTKNDDAE